MSTRNDDADRASEYFNHSQRSVFPDPARSAGAVQAWLLRVQQVEGTGQEFLDQIVFDG
jgi:hypothetical protein